MATTKATNLGHRSDVTLKGTTTTIETDVVVSDTTTINNAGNDVGLKINSTSTGHIMQLQDNGTDVMVVADGGDVGIGASPDTKLNIVQSSTGRSWSPTGGQGDLIVERNGNAGISIVGANGSTSNLNFGDTDDENAGFISYDHSDNSMSLRTNGSGTDLTIDSSGKVGIGTDPSSILHVDEGSGTSGFLFDSGLRRLKIVGSNSDGGYVSLETTDQDGSNASSRNLILEPNGGNVGINTTSFTSIASGRNILELNGSSTVLFNISIGGTRQGYMYHDTNNMYFYNVANNDLIFGTNNNEKAKITASGDFKASNSDNAGSDSYGASGMGHVFHTSSSDRAVTIENSHDSTPLGLCVDFSDANPNSTSYWYFLATNSTNNANCAIYSNGNLANSNNSYGTFSDERLKTNISEASSQWDDIKALNFKKYKLKEHGENATYHLGLIAQEVENTSPNLVEEYPASEYHIETLGFGKDEMVKGIKSSIVFMKGMVALQEAMTRIETLESKVNATN